MIMEGEDQDPGTATATAGCCGSCYKWFIYIVNFMLFLIGALQVGIAGYLLVDAPGGVVVFTTDVLGNDAGVRHMLVFGGVLIFLSILGCTGAKRESKCMLWIYAFILFLLISFQAMSLGEVNVYLRHSEPIFGSMWKKLDNDTVINIEETFECCSFNGADIENTWESDIAQYENCTAMYPRAVPPTETCWGKFNSAIEENYLNLKRVFLLFILFQILIYFSTQYMIHSLGVTDSNGDVVRPSSAYWGPKESYAV